MAPMTTVLLFPGGGGVFGKVEDGRATSNNFLVRSMSYFSANEFNVAIFGLSLSRLGALHCVSR